VTLEALELEEDERDQGEPDRDVQVRGGRAQLFELADGRDEPAPVAEQDEDEEPGEQREVRLRVVRRAVPKFSSIW
jgi:hypothetical protein